GCLDQFGTLHEIGETWSTVDPCLLFHCTTGGITTERIRCDDTIPPHIGCLEYTPKGECCPKWNCSGCVDYTGTYHPLYDVWKTDPCTTHLCTKNGIETTREKCDLGPAPHHSCVKVTPPGECCPEWECRGCLDQFGTLHEIGETWSTVDPCLLFHCTTGGITTERIHCEDSSAPHIGCLKYTPKGECCPQWNCSGCVDRYGTYHTLYDVWKTDPCTTHLCTKNGIQTTREDCDTGPAPHPSCVKITLPGECCPDWNCRGCLDQLGKLHEIGEAWDSVDPCLVFHCTTGGITTERIHCNDTIPPHIGCREYTPKGECCPKWNCSGCVDYTGTYHPLYDVWKTDPCTTHLCTKNGIETTREKCDLGPAPHHSCVKVTPPGECCPEWECRGCLDQFGTLHEIGETWSTVDPCLLFHCTTGGITTERIRCDDTIPPHIGCLEYTPKGECCPKWNCSGCVDHTGTYHPLYDVWKTDPCTTHLCTKNGIETTREKCDLGPAPHPSCVEVSPPGECCPEWKC
ncbi:kielin/chordin-like protein, partial [Homarus americanus]|uniref:kielin/chordin-like protein n=1 Tax=Homarus americanus TaxID=6706 RepID=UPI001C45268E